jgi:hypothetical protein
MTKLIQAHPKTGNIALFKSSRGYWIGVYSSMVAAGLGSQEPPYVWYQGFDSEAEGLAYLASMKGDEF